MLSSFSIQILKKGLFSSFSSRSGHPVQETLVAYTILCDTVTQWEPRFMLQNGYPGEKCKGCHE